MGQVGNDEATDARHGRTSGRRRAELRRSQGGLRAICKCRHNPGYAGVRPKIARPGGSATDFMIQTPKDRGVAGLVNLFGIESPGLTSCLAIADWVRSVALGR